MKEANLVTGALVAIAEVLWELMEEKNAVRTIEVEGRSLIFQEKGIYIYVLDVKNPTSVTFSQFQLSVDRINKYFPEENNFLEVFSDNVEIREVVNRCFDYPEGAD